MTRTRIIRTMKDTRNRRGWMVMGWLWLGLLTARAGLACSPTITCLDCQTGENGLLLVATGQAATFRVYPTYCGVLNTDWLVDGVTESSATGIQYKFTRTFSAATPPGQPHTVRAVITNDDSGTAISVGSNTLSVTVTVTANAFTVNIVPSAGCTVTAGDGGVDNDADNDPQGNGIACAGGMAADHPLCAEQFQNKAVAALKVTTEPGYGFTGWIVDGAHIKLTSAEPLFLATRPVLANNGADVQVKNGCTNTQADCSPLTVYLTFDDGPLGGTNTVLQVFSEPEFASVSATLFMVGLHYDNNPPFGKQQVETAANAPTKFEIGNHSYSHLSGTTVAAYYQDTDKAAQNVLSDFRKNDAVFSTALSLPTPKQFGSSRFPTRNIWNVPSLNYRFIDNQGKNGNMAADLLGAPDQGYRLYGWDVEWERDGKSCPSETPAAVIQKIQDKFNAKTVDPARKNKVVVLMHDMMFWTSEKHDCATHDQDEQLRELLRALIKKKYQLAVIADYK